MYQNCSKSAQILFSVADATWRTEAARLFGWSADDPRLPHYPEAQGRPHTLLRIAYEVRQQALSHWEASRSNSKEFR